MAVKWTSQRNERLLLLIVQDVTKVDNAKLAKRWSEEYGDDNFQPTARAIQEQFGSLKKRAGGKGKGAAKSTGTVFGTPKTPRTGSKNVGTPRKSPSKSSTTPSKRKKSRMSDGSSGPDDDDDEDIDLKNFKPSTGRASLARAKKLPKRYEDPDSEDENAYDETDDGSIAVKSERGVGASDSVMGVEVHVAATAKPRTGLTSKMSELMANGTTSAGQAVGRRGGGEIEMDLDEDSDISDFAKSFAS